LQFKLVRTTLRRDFIVKILSQCYYMLCVTITSAPFADSLPFFFFEGAQPVAEDLVRKPALMGDGGAAMGMGVTLGSHPHQRWNAVRGLPCAGSARKCGSANCNQPQTDALSRVSQNTLILEFLLPL
jgi:hypothetical protein